MQPKRNFLSARIASFGYAFKGIWVLLRTQPNAWIHATATVAVIVAGLLLHVKPLEWALLCLAMGMVWAAEGMNTAIESVVDLASPDRHPLAGRAKDVAAGAVLLAALFAVGVAAFVFVPHLCDCRPSPEACHKPIACPQR
jgi:diacylglycerol kinase (ATP)